jgi:hypothetical protein
MGKTLAMLTMSVDYDLAELRDMMRQGVEFRSAPGTWVLMIIAGYDDDPRELWDIPEVQAFCRRLIKMGMLAALDPAIEFQIDGMPKPGWGAVDVWLAAHGLIKGHRVELNEKEVARYRAALKDADATSSAALVQN